MEKRSWDLFFPAAPPTANGPDHCHGYCLQLEGNRREMLFSAKMGAKQEDEDEYKSGFKAGISLTDAVNDSGDHGGPTPAQSMGHLIQ
jgi:hypothetical protein